MKKYILFFAIFLLIFPFLRAEKLAGFDLLIKSFPHFQMNDRHFIIADSQLGWVQIYDRQTYKKLFEFGKIGEGPGEFIRHIGGIILDKDRIIVESMGRLSFFDFKGTFIKDIRLDMGSYVVGKVGKNFLTESRKGIEKVTTHLITLCDLDLKEVKTVYKNETQRNMSIETIQAISSDIRATTGDDHFILADQRNKGEITLFDQNAIQQCRINHPFEVLTVSSKARQKMRDVITASLQKSRMPQEMKDKMKVIVPDVYPPFRYVSIAGTQIWVFTYRELDKEQEILVFNFSGLYLGLIHQPHDEAGLLNNGYFYRLKENEETEMWELHRYPVKKPVLSGSLSKGDGAAHFDNLHKHPMFIQF